MKAIRHFGIVTGNMKDSLHFYKDLLGLKIKREMHEEGEPISKVSNLEGVEIWTIKMAADNGDVLVELLEYANYWGKHREDYKIYDYGASHIAFTVENLDKEYERLSKEGVKFNSDPTVSIDGKVKVCHCFDPNGVFIELVEEL